MAIPGRRSAGFTLLELLIVISVLVVLAGLAMPNSSATLRDQLQASAEVLSADLCYGRSLAVANNSCYRFRFDRQSNTYTLQHSGTNSALHTLPRFPFQGPKDTATQRVVDLGEQPHLGPPTRLAAVAAEGNTLTAVGDVEFDPLGGTTRSGATVIWLAAGQGPGARYITLSVNAVTGLVSIGPYTGTAPPAWLTAVP